MVVEIQNPIVAVGDGDNPAVEVGCGALVYAQLRPADLAPQLGRAEIEKGEATTRLSL
jgi:hypothetical protein